MAIEKLRGIVKDEVMTTNEVVRFLKISRSTLYRRIRAKVFPKPIKVTCRTQYWIKSDLINYKKERKSRGMTV